jgi:CubicO group peptidase (beta-lactamase class C family)
LEDIVHELNVKRSSAPCVGRWAVGFLAILSGCSATPDDTPRVSANEPVVASVEQPLPGDTLVAPRPVYTGIWRSSGASRRLAIGRTQSQFLAAYDTYWNEGYRLFSLSTSVVNGQVQYTGAWHSNTAGQFVGLGRNQEQLLADYETWWNNGYRLIQLTANVVNGQLQYNGVWNPTTTAQFLGLARTEAQFLAEYNTWWNKGYRLVTLTSNVVDGQVLYSGVWNPSTAGQFLGLGRTRAQFQAEVAARASGGSRVAAVSTYVLNDVVYYNAIWNPGTYKEIVVADLPEREFLATNDQNTADGYRIGAIITDHVEAVALNRIASHLKSAYDNRAVGYAATILSGSTRRDVSGGHRRTASDPPSAAASPNARMNVMSASKTLTATAVLQLLRFKGLTIDSPISPWLPGDWVRGPNIGTITFKELLTHRSGLRGNANNMSYSHMKTTIENGINLADKASYVYFNQNYSLFRVIVPYLNGFSDSTADKDTGTATAFMAYMNSRVFGPAGISTVTALPGADGAPPTLAYPFPAGTAHGTDFGDFTFRTGAAGFQLSSAEMARFLVKLRDGTLLPSSWQTIMDTNMLGWRDNHEVRHGILRAHPGGWGTTEIGKFETRIASFTTGVQVGLVINSVLDGVGSFAPIKEGYNNAWVPIPQ